MNNRSRPGWLARLARPGMGERLGGFVYGTIVVMAVVVAGARAFPEGPGHIAALVVVTTAVFWFAHVYAHALAHTVSHDQHLSLSRFQDIARREAAILEAGAPPVAALLLGALGAFSARTATWIALGLGLAVLAAEGLVFARVERLSWAGTLAVVTANLALGLLIVAMKAVVTH